jgi:hypothetical protein
MTYIVIFDLLSLDVSHCLKWIAGKQIKTPVITGQWHLANAKRGLRSVEVKERRTAHGARHTGEDPLGWIATLEAKHGERV